MHARSNSSASRADRVRQYSQLHLLKFKCERKTELQEERKRHEEDAELDLWDTR